MLFAPLIECWRSYWAKYLISPPVDTVGFGTSNAQTSPVSGIYADDDVICTIDGSIFNKSSLSEITGMALIRLLQNRRGDVQALWI